MMPLTSSFGHSRTALGACAAAASLCAWAVIALAPAAGADSADPTAGAASGSALSGYSAGVQAIGIQYVFTIPNLIPVSGNMVEDDAAFARTSITNGPVVNALGAPYYPGDILANFGSLISEFAGKSPFPNDPLLADANYPPSPGRGTDATFGGTPPAGSPIAPNVFSATAHAGSGGASVSATLLDVAMSAPSGGSSAPATFGPQGGVGAAPGSPAPPLAAPIGSSPPSSPPGSPPAPGSPALDVGSIALTNDVTLSDSAITGDATCTVKAVEVAGVLRIGQIVSQASAQSDGTTPKPAATTHLVDVSADGQPAYIDSSGVHVSGNSPGPGGITPQQAQSALNTTFAQDGITVRLIDPTTNANGSEATADSGGVVVSVTHPFSVLYVPGEPTLPLPGLGNQGVPAGNYTAVSSITLGAATSDVQAAASVPFTPGAFGTPGSGDLGNGTSGLGGGASGGGISGASGEALGPPSSPGNPGTAASGPTSITDAARTTSLFPLGIPTPVGWLIAALALCIVTTYPMLLAVRWQFLIPRKR